MERDQAIRGFFGDDEEVISTLPRPSRVAYARDNARLFIGNVVNNVSTGIDRYAVSIDGFSMTSATGTALLTFTTAVLAVVTEAANWLCSCQSHAAKLKIADLSIIALYTECSAIRLELKQIENLMLREGDEVIEARVEAYLVEELQNWLQACCVLFSIMNQHFAKLGLAELSDTDRGVFKAHLQSIWTFPQMDLICQNVQSSARAIGILSAAFQSGTAIRASSNMNDPETKGILASVSNDAMSMCESFFTAQEGGVGSIRSSVIGAKIFDFDVILGDTKLYRRGPPEQAVKSNPKESQQSLDGGATWTLENTVPLPSHVSMIAKPEDTAGTPYRKMGPTSCTASVPRLSWFEACMRTARIIHMQRILRDMSKLDGTTAGKGAMEMFFVLKFERVTTRTKRTAAGTPDSMG